MPVKKGLIGIIKPPELIKKEVPQAVMNKTVVIKLSQLRLVSLAAADNDRARIRDPLKISDHLGAGLPVVNLPMLKRGNHLVALADQRLNL